VAVRLAIPSAAIWLAMVMICESMVVEHCWWAWARMFSNRQRLSSPEKRRKSL